MRRSAHMLPTSWPGIVTPKVLQPLLVQVNPSNVLPSERQKWVPLVLGVALKTSGGEVMEAALQTVSIVVHVSVQGVIHVSQGENGQQPLLH
jgi:hypothetical protein